nr:actin-depolymerizing factor 5 [Tanacetum cinerariifolium]
MWVTDECKNSFMEMKRKKVHRCIVFKIDETSKLVTVDKSCKDAMVTDSVPVAATRDSGRPGSPSGTARSREKDHGFPRRQDERVFPTVADWRTSSSKDEMPAENTYSLEAVMALNTHRTPIQKQPEALLCLVGLSRRYFLRDEVYPTFLYDDDQDGYLCNTPENVSQWKYVSGALLHNTTAQDIGERPLNVV